MLDGYKYVALSNIPININDDIIAYVETYLNDIKNNELTGLRSNISKSPLTTNRLTWNVFAPKKNRKTVSVKYVIIKNIITASLVKSPNESTYENITLKKKKREP